MKLNYKLERNDILQYELYNYSQNYFKGFKDKALYYYAGVFFIAGLLSLIEKNYVAASFLILLSIFIILFTPSRMKNDFFDKKLKEIKKINTDKNYSLEFKETSIEYSSDDFTLNHNIDVIQKFVEVKIGFYLIYESNAIIIPKLESFNITELKGFLLLYSKKNNIEFKDSLNWKY